VEEFCALKINNAFVYIPREIQKCHSKKVLIHRQKMHQKVSKYGLLQEIPCFFSTEFKKKIYQKRKLPI